MRCEFWGVRIGDTSLIRNSVVEIIRGVRIKIQNHDPLVAEDGFNSLGSSFGEIGKREESQKKLRAALRNFKKCLDRELDPRHAARALDNTGQILLSLWKITGVSIYLERSIGCHAEALDLREVSAPPQEIANSLHDMACALTELGSASRDTQALRRAINQFGAAIELRDPDVAQFERAMSSGAQGEAKLLLAIIDVDPSMAVEARNQLQEASEYMVSMGVNDYADHYSQLASGADRFIEDHFDGAE